MGRGGGGSAKRQGEVAYNRTGLDWSGSCRVLSSYFQLEGRGQRNPMPNPMAKEKRRHAGGIGGGG